MFLKTCVHITLVAKFGLNRPMDYCHFVYITKLKKIKIKIPAHVNLVCKEATPTLSEWKFGTVCIVNSELSVLSVYTDKGG
jgi:hypothetical protein